MVRIRVLGGICALALVVGLGAVGCSSSTSKPGAKMDKMADKKDDMMAGDKMEKDKMASDKIKKK